MHIVSHVVTQVVVDEISLRPDEWDPTLAGKIVWRQHMAALLNQRAKKIAPKCQPSEFYHEMLRFAQSLGFGSVDAIIAVTEAIYNGKLIFTEEERLHQQALRNRQAA